MDLPAGAQVIGVGIDVVDLDRFRMTLARRPRLSERLFTAGERSAVEARRDPVPSLAARFAAKEAAMKALGVGLGAFAFHDVEVVRDASGAPSLRVSGAAAALAGERGVTSFLVSITHTDTTAEAVVAAH